METVDLLAEKANEVQRMKKSLDGLQGEELTKEKEKVDASVKQIEELAEKYKEKPDICNAIGAHHDEVEMESLLAPIVQVCDAISGARPGARREIVEAYMKRLNDLEQLAMSYPGVTKTYAIQAGRELRVIVGADKIDDKTTETLSADIAKKIQDEMTYPGQVKITVIRETRAVSYARWHFFQKDKFHDKGNAYGALPLLFYQQRALKTFKNHKSMMNVCRFIITFAAT